MNQICEVFREGLPYTVSVYTKVVCQNAVYINSTQACY